MPLDFSKQGERLLDFSSGGVALEDFGPTPAQYEPEPEAPPLVIRTEPWQEPGADLGPWTGGPAAREERMQEAGALLRPALSALALPAELAGKAAVTVADLPTRLANIQRERQGREPIALLGELPRPQIPTIPGRDIPTGIANAVIGTANQLVPVLAPPEVGLTLPVLAAGGPIGRAGALTFGAAAGASLPDLAQQTVSVLEDPNATPAEKSEAVGNLAIQGGFATAMLRAAAKTPKPTWQGPVPTGELLRMPSGAQKPRAEPAEGLLLATPEEAAAQARAMQLRATAALEPKRLPKPVVPEGPTEPMPEAAPIPSGPKAIATWDEAVGALRALGNGTETKPEIQAMFPELKLSREAAGGLAKDAFGDKWLPGGKPKPAPTPVAEEAKPEVSGVKYARRPDGTLKTKGEYTSEEWKAYTDSVIEAKLKLMEEQSAKPPPVISEKAQAETPAPVAAEGEIGKVGEVAPSPMPPAISEAKPKGEVAQGPAAPPPEPPAVPAKTTVSATGEKGTVAESAASKKATEKEEIAKVNTYAAAMVQSAGNYIRREIDSGKTPKQAALAWAREIGMGLMDTPDSIYPKTRGGLYTSTYIKAVFGTKEGVAVNAKEYLKAIDDGRQEGLKWKQAQFERQKALSEASAGVKALGVREPETAGRTARETPPPAKAEEVARETPTPPKPPVVKESLTTEPAKQPWEMTREEFSNENKAKPFLKAGLFARGKQAVESATKSALDLIERAKTGAKWTVDEVYAVADALGFTIAKEPAYLLGRHTSGESGAGKISLRPNRMLSGRIKPEAIETVIHEMGHELLHEKSGMIPWKSERGKALVRGEWSEVEKMSRRRDRAPWHKNAGYYTSQTERYARLFQLFLTRNSELKQKAPTLYTKVESLIANSAPAIIRMREVYKPHYESGISTIDLAHKYEVKVALSEGKPVRPEVLADYPDLAKAAVVPAVAKVEAQVQKTAKTEGVRSAKEIKAELVLRLEKAIEEAPSEKEVGYKVEKITIEIPDDGVFTIWNTKENLRQLLSRAKRISTSTESKARLPTGAVASSEKALRSSDEAKVEVAKASAKELKGKARLVMDEAINKNTTEGLIASHEIDLDPVTDLPRMQEWQIRKTTPQEVAEYWKQSHREIRWIIESRIVKFDEQGNRHPGEWSFSTEGKTRAEAIRSAEHDTIHPGADLIDEGLKNWRNLENETGPFSYLAEGKPPPPESQPPSIAAKPPSPSVSEESLGAGGAGKEPAGAIALGSTPLTPAPPAPSLPPKAISQIIRDLAKGLSIPIRFGRLRTTKYSGYFQKLQNLIGAKRANDMPIVGHEVGHKLDVTLGLSRDPTISAELTMLGDPATPGSMSSWTKSKSAIYRRGEGMAEFVRYWLTDPAQATRLAPNTHAAFEAALRANVDLEAAMRQAQRDVERWRTAEAQARLHSSISIGENPNKAHYTVSNLTRDLVDDLHFVRLAVDDAKASGAVLPSQNPYQLARLLRGAYGMADTFIRRGIVDFKSKSVQLGTGLEDALKPVSGRVNDFRDWIVAKRAQELHRRGKNTGLLPSDVDATAARYDADPAFNEAFARIKRWNDGMLQYAVDSGLVAEGVPATATSPATGAYRIRELNQDYVPFHRIFEIGAGEFPAQEGAGTGRGLNVGKPGSLRGLKGSPRDIIDPLETMVKNAYSFITASEKNAINVALGDLANRQNMGKWVERIAIPKEAVRVEAERIRKQLEAAGADMTAVPDDLVMTFFRPSGRAPFGENVIRVNRGGKMEFYRLNKDLFDTFNALDAESGGKLIQLMAIPAQLLRAGVTLTPDFALSNALRDTMSAGVISRYGMTPFVSTIRGIANLLKNPQLVSEWSASGGRQAVEASYFDRAKLQRFLSEKITKDLTPAERALVVARNPFAALRYLTGLLEEGTRLGQYEGAYKKLVSQGMNPGEARRQAAFEARDLQDFAKGGAHTKVVRQVAAFWNAQLQANVRLAQSFKDRPFQTILKGLAFVTLPKLLEQAVNWNDEDYWDKPQWQRDLFYMIPIGKDENQRTRFMRIPIPFEVGLIFATVPGRFLQWGKQNAKAAFDEIVPLMLKQTVPVPTSFPAVPILEAAAGRQGYSYWRGKPIVPESLKQKPPELQVTEQTSLTARRIGRLLGLSPIKVDYLIGSYTGGLGRQLIHQGLDRGISAVSGEQRPSLSVVPFGRFIAPPSGSQSQAIERFYELLNEAEANEARAKAGQPRNYELNAKAMRRTADIIAARRKLAMNEKDPAKRQQHQLEMVRLAKLWVDRIK